MAERFTSEQVADLEADEAGFHSLLKRAETVAAGDVETVSLLEFFDSLEVP